MLGLRHFRGTAIDLFQGDITSFACDAIVNAANESLLGGGGVDGAIHRVGGPSILEACRPLAPCPTGEAVITPAGRLPATSVIHTVGPRWQGGGAQESEQLASAYRNSLRLAATHALPHVSFPAISTGVYSYPLEPAARVAMETLRAFLMTETQTRLRRVTFVLFDRVHYQAFQTALFQTFPETDEE